VAAYNAITDTVRAVNKELFNDSSAGPDARVFFAYTSDYIYWCVVKRPRFASGLTRAIDGQSEFSLEGLNACNSEGGSGTAQPQVIVTCRDRGQGQSQGQGQGQA
jgi:hypothetical protein